ncbi:MAG: response regulator transcription factor [Pseudobutyrivibrio sp.]|nr:response regulator transcription factor [Pseudobutyrivibrio sp.]
MMDILVCDDNQSIRESVKNSIVKYAIKTNIECTVFECENGEDIFKSIDRIKKDTLIFMDYKLGDNQPTGIEVVEKLRQQSINNKVVFLTAYPEIVYDTFKVGTYRFLIKPLKESELFEVLDSYRKTMNFDRLLKIKVGWDVYQIVQSSITYIESKGKKSILYYGDNLTKLGTNYLLYEIEKLLDENLFIRCHKSFIVNVGKIQRVRSNFVVMEGGVTIPVGRGKINELVEKHIEATR